MTELPSLADLLQATARGDRPAFDRLYSMSSAQLFGVMLRILRQRNLAEDALQEVYVGIWHKADSYASEKASAMAWMIAIARNRAIDIYRRERRQPITGQEADADCWVDPDPGPLDRAMASEEARGLWHCLDQLEEAQRDSILLAYREGRSHEEIAGHLDKPLGTVKSWIRRGLIRLRRCLEP